MLIFSYSPDRWNQLQLYRMIHTHDIYKWRVLIATWQNAKNHHTNRAVPSNIAALVGPVGMYRPTRTPSQCCLLTAGTYYILNVPDLRILISLLRQFLYHSQMWPLAVARTHNICVCGSVQIQHIKSTCVHAEPRLILLDVLASNPSDQIFTGHPIIPMGPWVWGDITSNPASFLSFPFLSPLTCLEGVSYSFRSQRKNTEHAAKGTAHGKWCLAKATTEM